MVFSLWVVPATAWAEDDDDAESSEDEEAIGEPDPWERPPEEEEPPPDEPMAAPVDEPIGDGRPLQLGLALGYGFESEKNVFGANPYGFGAGLRGGYSLDFGLYVGGSTTYFLGGTQHEREENSVSAWLIAAEVGYDVWLGPAIFRPSAEVGAILTFSTADVNSGLESTTTAMYIAPGATVIYPIDEFYLGGDFRIPLAVGDGQGTVTLMLVGGLRLDTED